MEHWKCIRISGKAHLRSDFRKKNTSFSGARTHKSTILEQYIFRAEIEKYFRWFLVQMKTVESAFEINWPLKTVPQKTLPSADVSTNFALHKIFPVHQNHAKCAI